VGKELEIRPGLVLPADELHVEAVRSGGPGGQNVNKVASKIVLRFSPGGSRALDDNQKQRIATRLAARLTAAGEVVVHASRHREQRRNLEDARGRLAELLAAALARPRRRVATKPTQGSKRRRLDSKRRRSDTKRGRGGGGVAD
jgi:ribosome-associated protein